MRKRAREEHKPKVYYEVENGKFPGPFETLEELSKSLMLTAITDENPPIIKIYQPIEDSYQLAFLKANFKTLMNLKVAIACVLNSTPTPIPKRILQQKSLVLKTSLFSEGKLEKPGKIISDKGVELSILDSKCCDFLNGPLVSLGEQIFQNTSREGIILDPKSETLHRTYAGIARILPQESPLLKKLDIVLNALKKLFIYTTHLHLDAVVRGHSIDSISPKNQGEICHLVPLQAFLQAQTGVCRHHSLVACYLIHRLIKDNLLPATAVHQVRGHVRGQGHAWVMIKENNGQWIHFDSQWQITRKIDEDGYTALCGNYTKEAIDAAMKKLNEQDDNDLTSTPGL